MRLGDRDHRLDLAAQRALKERERLPAGLVHIDMRMRLAADDDIHKPGDRRVEIRVQIDAHRERVSPELGARGADQLEVRAQRARTDERAVKREIERIGLRRAHAIGDLAHHLLEIGFLHCAAGAGGGAAQADRSQSPICSEEIDRRADFRPRAAVEGGHRVAGLPFALAKIGSARRDRRERISLVPQARDGDYGRFVIMRARSQSEMRP